MRDGSGDSGMTLVELLMAMAILMIIITPIIGAFFLAMITAESTGQRVTDSGGGQILSSYLSSDVQSSSGDAVRATAPFDCDQDAVLELGWKDAQTGDSTRVAYVPRGESGQDPQLRRLVYDHTPAGCSLADESLLLRAVDVASIVVTCAPAPCGATTRTVRLDLTAFGKAPRDDTYYAPFPISLTGTRRTAS